ncbi:MAG: ABC-type dipeptide/oligopeptide/nickel transport system permease subunit [Myxococcota bacterium]|jgi:ABC-type dipeptide/oligopeptide/nickel transport system permease subunit
MNDRIVTGALAGLIFASLVLAALSAPEHFSAIQPDLGYATPAELPPFGADNRGRPLLDYATQGAQIVAVPAAVAGLLVFLFGVIGGLLRCAGSVRVDSWIQGMGEILGSLPRMVVILVVALVVPLDSRGLMPLAIVWALLSAPGAMDEAAAVAERLGGARFVEALRAHGYSAFRIYLYHIVALNLRPVVVRQAVETMMQVVFLEIALSYLALAQDQPSFTHADSLHSWADLLNMGYPALILDIPTTHALVLGLSLVGMVAVMTLSVSRTARAR